jgi:AraC-like DNA-binding protein
MPPSNANVLRFEPEPARCEPLERVKSLVSALAPQDGHRVLTDWLSVYRFSSPTSFRKGATFGVTLGVVLQGGKRVRLHDHELTLDPTRLLVITSETEHESAVLQASEDEPYLGLSLCFCPERVASALLALADAGETSTHETVPAFAMPYDDAIAGALERLLGTLGDPLERKLLAPLVVDELLFRLLRSDAAAAVRSGVGQAADAHRILDAMQYMRTHHAQKLTVENIARHHAMSPSHFAHRFRAVARISPMRYLREVRLEQARTLVLQPGARASEVANQVGFESAAHFTREFKRRFGVPPSRARG